MCVLYFVLIGTPMMNIHRYGNEQGIMKYIRIAASLPSKTVRDVAMKCQWLGVSNL